MHEVATTELEVNSHKFRVKIVGEFRDHVDLRKFGHEPCWGCKEQ